MDRQRPRSREKQVTGAKRTIQRRGGGLGSGPVGRGSSLAGGGPASGPGGRPSGRMPSGNGGTGGLPKLLIILAVLLFGGGGALLGNHSGQAPTPGTPGTQQSPQQTGSGSSSIDLASILGGLSGGNVSGGWLEPANTGKLNTDVDTAARPKRVSLLGGGKDTATIMVYLCGTDLESKNGMGTADIQEMLAADFDGQINLLIYTGGCTGWRNNQISSRTNQIWQVKDKQLVCLEPDLGNLPMTDPSTLTNYIKWCAANHPASRYELIFWDHGGGSISGYGYDQKFPSGGSMGLAGIHTALENAGVEFDFIGFDACLMATAENALMLAEHGDYLIASEETEPGVGWYYTNWLTAFGKDPSMPTVQLGKMIADDFVDVCASRCPGQLTTLSVIDLAELEATVPSGLTDFSNAASSLIASRQYQVLSDARSNTREFARSSRIDHVDLVHLAKNLGNPEGNALADALLSAVKYNRTSSNMTNAYGLSIYFPYQNVAKVDQAVASYQKIGMDEAYTRCIKQFASMEAGGQAVSGGTTSPLPALLGSLSGGGGADMVSQMLGSFLSGGFDTISGLSSANTGFLQDKAMDSEEMAAYLSETRFAPEALVWQTGADGTPVLSLEESQWALIQALELNLFYDDGAGYLDMGLDNVFEWNEEGQLLGINDGTWLAIEGQPVAYYHTSTVDDGEHYTITGYVPVLHNGQRAELLLTFDNENPYGYVSGVRAVYPEEETETVAKNGSGLAEGDTLDFLCDYYTYEGEYQDSYMIGEPLTVTDPQLSITNVPLDGRMQATYRFTDLYCQHYWTPPMP